jgi:hypothetical protein
MKGVVVLWFLMLAPVAVGQGIPQRSTGVYAGVSVVGLVPVGEELRAAYGIGLGAGVEVGLRLHRVFRVVVSAAPSYSPGSPTQGPLAADASGRLWSIPMSAGVQIVLRKASRMRTYFGAGLLIQYVHERLDFSSPLGDRSETRSYAPIGLEGQIGVEQNRSRRFFGELWYLAAKAAGLQGGGLGRNVGGLQLRLGYRTDL